MMPLDVLLLLHCWLNYVYFHPYVDLSLLEHVRRFSVLSKGCFELFNILNLLIKSNQKLLQMS